MRFLLHLLSSPRGRDWVTFGARSAEAAKLRAEAAKTGENPLPNVILMLFFPLSSRKSLIISQYIAIYWIFLCTFARIFRQRPKLQITINLFINF